jgi:DNA (cytosine-5)-methyltransferase 1
MGFSNKDFNKASKVVSETQLYKQAGNSIVVDVLEKIFIAMFQIERKN